MTSGRDTKAPSECERRAEARGRPVATISPHQPKGIDALRAAGMAHEAEASMIDASPPLRIALRDVSATEALREARADER